MSDTAIEQPRVRILIVDDHAMVRDGLRHFIYGFAWMEVVADVSNGVEAVEYCATHDVDVVLMDMVMPVMDGSEATRRITELGKDIAVIALTSFHERDLVENALRAGAMSYLLKNVSAQELAEAIRAAHGGRSVLAPEATDALIDATRQRPGVVNDLTEREREALALLVQGKSNLEIAECLSISMPTVKFHLNNVFTKLGARNRVEATTIALAHNLNKPNP